MDLAEKNDAHYDLEIAKLIFSQAEDCLEESQIAADKLTDRAYTYISIILAAMAAIIGYAVEHFTAFYDNLAGELCCLLSLPFFLFLLYDLKTIITPKPGYRKGSTPESMMVPIPPDVDKEIFLAGMYLNLAGDYGVKIKSVDDNNAKNAKLLTTVLEQLFWFPFFLIMGYCAFSIMSLGLQNGEDI